MPSTLQAYRQMADHAATQITGSYLNWTAFLQTAARLYKYPYNEQVMIHAQRPDATACAEYDVWNEKMRRYVRRGSKGIALIDVTGDRPKLRYVFDVSDTGGRDDSRRPFLWELRREHADAVTAMLERGYDVSAENGLSEQLEHIASQLAREYWNDSQRDISGIVDDSFLEEYDAFNIGVQFRNAAAVSIAYSLMSRCGLDPDEYFDHEDFLSVFDFNTPETSAALGTAISEINQRVLRQIEVTIKNYEREHSADVSRSEYPASNQRETMALNEPERTEEHGEQPDLHAERGLPDSQPDALGAERDAAGQVREDAETLSEGAPPHHLEQPDSVGEAVPPSAGDRRDGAEPDGTDDAGTDEVGGRDGEPESLRPDEMGGPDEQPESAGGGNPSERADFQLNDQPAQLSLFPSEGEQIAFIEQAESVEYAPFAFSFPQEDIDHVLRLGGNNDNSRMRVAAEYMKQKPPEDIAAFLSREYVGGAGFKTERGDMTAWFTADGMRLARGRTAQYASSAQIIPWTDAAARIGELLEQGQFATNVELAETKGYVRGQLAEALWYLRRDFDEPAIEQGYLPSMEGFRGNGFPEETAKLVEGLSKPEYLAAITREYGQFLDAYRENRNLLRFRNRHTDDILSGLRELAQPWREYTTDMAEPPKQDRFITEDEISAVLTHGSPMEGGKGRIYGYFSEMHTSKEQAAFLKNEYGIGGHSGALPGSFSSWEDHSGKGVELRKSDCVNVQMSWSVVAKRISELVRRNRYLTPEERGKYEEIQRAKETKPEPEQSPAVDAATSSLYDSYADIKRETQTGVLLYQVGDFFEMLGEDAETAADALGLDLTFRRITPTIRMSMCCIPANRLEQYVEKLHDAGHDAVIYGKDEVSGELRIFRLDAPEARKLAKEQEESAPARRELTQEDIDAALQIWNGDAASKRRVAEYMAEHARDKDTAAWLSREYGGTAAKSLFVTVTGTDLTAELPWPKVQRRIAQLIANDAFYADHDDTVIGGSEPEPVFAEISPDDAANPFDDEAADVTVPEPDTFPYAVGDTVYLEDGKAFIVEDVSDLHIQLRDPTLIYPIWRSESRESFARLMQRYPQPEKAVPQMTSETVAVYPAERNGLPYDIVIQTMHTGEPERTPPPPAAENFRIADDSLGVGGAKAKFRMNMDAINLLKELEFDGRQATSEEQETLSRYVGWGGLADAFDETKQNWASEFQELYAALSPEEYAAARASTLNAHYTSPAVIHAIYDAVGNMGFQTGNILEPSMGVGNFFGCLPEEMRGSKLYGVELDSLTGRIAKQLYPQADITVAGFETTDRRDFFDLAIGNVPFGQYSVNDRAYNKLGLSIHNYFFAKALDQVRPGGVVAFVTSRYTMDAKDSSARRYIAQRADLLGAIRLPNNAFKANAGTDVVSDIIFLQKRDRPIEIEPDWVHLGENDDGFAINSYFTEHPEMILGRQTSESTQYGRQDFTVAPIEGLELSDQLADAIKSIRGTYAEAELPELGEGEGIDTSIPADPYVKNYSYTVRDGEIYYRENSRMVKPDLNATAKERVKGMVALRDCVHQLIDLQMDEYTQDTEITAKQAELNRLYDRFADRFGRINERGNRLAFSDDSSYYLLCSLEILDDDQQFERKADMFTKRTIKQHTAVTSVDTASEALAVSIGERAKVDLPFMSQLCKKTEDEITTELRGVIFHDPASQAWQTGDEYLSGNVRQKLREARQAAEQDSAFSFNVEALEKAQPKDLDASEIEVRLGATWISKEYIQQFMEETFKPPFYLRRELKVNYVPYTAEWQITGKSRIPYNDVAAFTTYGTDRANAYRILEDSLNLRDVRIYDTVEDPDGKERRVLNGKETTLAAQKQQAIREAFKDWIWRDPERRQTLVQQYNEEMNSTRPREYDGSHITFVGMNPEIQLREHQKNAVAHVLYGGNTLLAHEVGAGKTFEMVAACMESKRLGLSQKSIFIVPNHITEQWASEFLRLYPSANILVTTNKDFETHRRKKFCARIATGDYDAVIIGHSQFERIPISPERQERLLQDQIDEITDGIAEVEASGGERFTVKQLERTRKGLEARLEKLQADGRKDDVVTFEQLGCDRMFVDESDNYKNLFLYTKMRNVAGLSTTDAQKSSDMFAKCRYMDELTGSRGTVFATGTPISNSMTEMYTIQRYLQYERLRELNMLHFDCWASRFGETVTALELAPEGTGYRPRTRFAKFFNLPELMNMFKEVADIKTADQLDLPLPEVEYHTVVSHPTEQQKAMVQQLSERAAAIHSGSVDPSIDNMLKITSDGRKLGLDQRIINDLLPDAEGTKVNRCVENIMQYWRDGDADRLTQLVFCDISTPKASAGKRAAKAVSGNLDSPEIHALETAIDLPEKKPVFTVYDDIRRKLIEQGMPSEQIAFIHEANTDVRKKQLFGKVCSGQVRVLIGSTEKMGAGTNVQDRLVALHDLDCPWRPRDLTQRKGRIERQGNKNEKVHVCRYVTEGTFDAYLWQTVENKQRFISQIMTSKSPVRSCEDVDATALSFAEIKALCAGDPRIKERMDLDVEVSKLKIMKADHQSKQFRLEDNLMKYFPAQIEQDKGFLSCYEADMKTLLAHAHPPDGFAGMEVRGDVLTDKENAGAALLDTFKDVAGLEPVSIGSYRGFAMSMTLENFCHDYVLTLKGQMTHRVELGKDARGNLTRIENALAQIPTRMQNTQAHLDNLYEQQKAAQGEVGKPFPQEQELKDKSARLIELDMELNMDNRQQAQPENIVAKSTRPSVLDKLKTAAAHSTPRKTNKKELEER